jgi:hypothetical protein
MQGLWYNIFCSQKINLSVFLIGIADHAGPLVMHTTERRKERKKPKATLKHKTNLIVRPRFFYSPIFGTALTCHFGTSMQCPQQPRGPLCVDSMWHSIC